MTSRSAVVLRWAFVIVSVFAVAPHGSTEPVLLRVGSVVAGPDSVPEIAELLRDYLLSVLSQRSRIVAIDERFEQTHRLTDEPTQNRAQALMLEGAVWEGDDELSLTLFLYESGRNSVLMAASFDVPHHSLSRTMRMVAEEVELAVIIDDLFRRSDAGQSTTPVPIGSLLERGEILPAWERFLMLHGAEDTTDSDLEFLVRTLAADELARLVARERVSTEDRVDAFVHLLLVDPATVPAERSRAVHRTTQTIPSILAAENQQQIRDIRRDFRRAERRRDPIVTSALLQSSEFLELSEFSFEDAYDLKVRHSVLLWRTHLRTAQALRRRNEFDSAARSLDHAERSVSGKPEVAREAIRLEAARERWIHRQEFVARQPRWDEPRTVRDRAYHITFGTGGIADPASRFLVDSFATHVGIGYDESVPILPFARRVVGGQVTAARWSGEQGNLEYRWFSVYPSGYVGISVGTERVEFTSAVTGGLRMITGERETAQGSSSATHVAPALGLQFEAALYVPALHARVGIVSQTSRAVWIPSVYPTGMSTIGFRFAWIR